MSAIRNKPKTKLTGEHQQQFVTTMLPSITRVARQAFSAGVHPVSYLTGDHRTQQLAAFGGSEPRGASGSRRARFGARAKRASIAGKV